MYEFLQGEPAGRTPGRLVLQTAAGIGFDLAVPTGASFGDQLPLRVWTHLVVREDAHTLYGFPDRPTRQLFRLLLKVKKVGPGVALALLSGLRPEELLQALRDGDAVALTRVKGIGKKTAEQILLDLSDRVAEMAAELPRAAAPASSDSLTEDAVAALLSIGFPEKEARLQVERVLESGAAKDIETVLRLALKGKA